LLFCLAVAFGAGRLLPGFHGPRHDHAHQHHTCYLGWMLAPWGELYLACALPLLLILVLLVVVLVRRCQPAQRGPGPVGQYVETVLAVLLPCSAVFALSLLALTTAAARDSMKQAEVNRAIVEHGELSYYGLRVP
jgi:hypothetical protein